ncbi:hypothetical protein F0U62_22270 [Cystobacter fuscus]|uniref:hypothetical protein n=1 Tax=Cystobacter fuscus TaxID=43 RepID=UPI002B30C6DB|nr:hypothetical protein F0U62_22270 [Cystobacter fuscus]
MADDTLKVFRRATVHEAGVLLEPFVERMKAARPVDADPSVLRHGFRGVEGWSGAWICAGGRFRQLSLPPPLDLAATLFIDGDVEVDTWLEHQGQTFIRGNLTVRTLLTSGFLCVAGDVRAERFVGVDEPEGTWCLGHAAVGELVCLWNHCVSGTSPWKAQREGHEPMRIAELLATWGVTVDSRLGTPDWDDLVDSDIASVSLPALRVALRDWAERPGS